MTEVYGAGEMPQPGINGKLIGGCDLRDARPPGRVLHSPARRHPKGAARDLRARRRRAHLGAGDISSAGEELLESWNIPALRNLLRAFVISAAVAALTTATVFVISYLCPVAGVQVIGPHVPRVRGLERHPQPRQPPHSLNATLQKKKSSLILGLRVLW